MTSVFIGRKSELAALERAYQQRRAALIPIYGRRRVGKSELILRFCRGKPHVYYAATRGTKAYQIRTFLRAAAEGLGQPWLTEASITEWHSALKLAAAPVAGKPAKRLVLVLDEFQWLCEAAPELSSVIQQLWDQDWQHGDALLVILCGSYIGFMEREVLGSKSPLFGRRTRELLLEPFNYAEAAEFFPGWSLENAARAYFICGGIPSYLKAFDVEASIDQNIQLNFLAVDAPLFREPEFLLREELREVGTYSTIIEAIAAGKTSHQAVAQFAGITPNHLPYLLKSLIHLGYVERRLPLVPGRPSRKQTRYAIQDALLRFWFRFIAPNQSMIRANPPERSFAALIQPTLESFYGSRFEGLCRAALPWLYRNERVSGKFAVGEFWNPHAQIDVVGLRADGWLDLGECRWGETGGLAAMLRDLSERAAHYPLRDQTVVKRLFTRRPFKVPPPPGVKLHHLAGLYDAVRSHV